MLDIQLFIQTHVELIVTVATVCLLSINSNRYVSLSVATLLQPVTESIQQTLDG